MDPFFAQQFGQPSTMFRGAAAAPPPGINFGQILGLDPAIGGLVTSVAQPLVGQMLGPRYMPGQVTSSMNLYDQYRLRNFYEMQAGAANAGTQVDRQTYRNYYRGVTQMMGQEFDAAAQQRADKFSQDVAAMAPVLATMAPELFDQLHGTRGSARVMAQQLASGGRYMTDPITGARGLSAQTVERMQRTMYDRMFGEGVDIREMRGVTAGQVGIMFDELSRRGGLGGAGTREESLREISRQTGQTIESLSQLPDVDQKIRDFDATRVEQRLKGWTKAVAAMKDVFGANGIMEASIPQLLEGIQAVTQGGMDTMSPDQIEQQVYQYGNMLRSSGITMEASMRMMSAAGQRAAAMGLDRNTGAFGAVMSGIGRADAMGQLFGDAQFRGKMSKDRAAAAGTQLAQNAQGSAYAQELGAILRLADEFGAIDMSKDSDASRLVKAIKNEQTEFTDMSGKTRRISEFQTGTGDGSFMDMLTRSGVDASQAQRAFGQRQAAIDAAAKAGGVQRITQDRQQREVLGSMAMYSVGAIQANKDRLTAVGISEEEANKMTQAAFRDLMNTATAKDIQSLGDNNLDPIIERMEKQRGRKFTDVERQAVRGLTADVVGSIKDSPLARQYDSYLNIFTMHNQKTRDMARTQEEVGKAEAGVQSEMAKLNRSSGFRRVMDALAKADSKTSFESIAADALGFVATDDVMKELQKPIQEFSEKIQALRNVAPDAVRKEMADPKTSPERKKELERIYGSSANMPTMTDAQIRVKALEEAKRNVIQYYPKIRDQLEAVEKRAMQQAPTGPDGKPIPAPAPGTPPALAATDMSSELDKDAAVKGFQITSQGEVSAEIEKDGKRETVRRKMLSDADKKQLEELKKQFNDVSKRGDDLRKDREGMTPEDFKAKQDALKKEEDKVIRDIASLAKRKPSEDAKTDPRGGGATVKAVFDKSVEFTGKLDIQTGNITMRPVTATT